MEDPLKYQEEEKAFKKQDPSKDLDISTLEEFEVADGKDRDKETIRELRAMEALFGIKESNPYETMNRQIFNERISDMTATDLQNLAMRVGVPPSRNGHELKRLLRNSFDSFVKKHDYGIASAHRPVIDESSPNYEEAKRLFQS
jgi:hypothetical protein